MKKTVLLSAVVLGTLGLIASAPLALANSVESPTTNGSVVIEAGSDPDFEGFIKPGTYDKQIDMNANYGKSGSSTGALRFNWVPNFDFGTVPATAYDKVVDSKIHAYTYDETGNGTGGNIYQFLQVQDLTGNKDSNFKVSLSATKFVDNPESPTKTLTNTRIRLKGFKTTNNLQYKTTPANTSLLFSATLGSNGYLELTPDSAVELLKTNTATEGNSSNGSVSSLVFNSGYNAGVDPTVTTNDQVQLFIPSTEMVTGTYKATLTWSLDDTK